MGSKLDHLFNLTNYRDHPENGDYQVFFYYNMEQAKFFESLLNKEGIAYESILEEEGKRPVMLYGIHKREFRKALLQNDLSYASFKKRFISNKWLRNGVLIITLAFVLFALIGYLKSQY